MRGHINLAPGLVFCALAGCAAAPPHVFPAGDDAFRLSVTGTRYETQADTNLKALRAAGDFCGNKGQHLMFRESTESGDHSWSPKQEDLTFVCMSTNDPAYMQASVPRNTVVAQQ
jgi:hypothetical protein